MLNELKKTGMNGIFIERFNKEDLTEEDMSLFSSDLKKSLCSVVSKHIYAWKLINKSVKPYNLICEDDVIFDDDFSSKFQKYMSQVPDDFDMVFLEDSVNLHIPEHIRKIGKNIYLKCNEETTWGGLGATRCTGLYVLSKKCASKLLDYVNNLNKNSIYLNVDLWLNHVIRDLNLKIYWAEPVIATQGSASGLFSSTNL